VSLLWSPELLAFLAVIDERNRLRAELDASQSRRTLGGTARPVSTDWANVTVPPPPSASDGAMPAHRRAGFTASGPHPISRPNLTDGEPT
jgi:hypothetical protein